MTDDQVFALGEDLMGEEFAVRIPSTRSPPESPPEYCKRCGIPHHQAGVFECRHCGAVLCRGQIEEFDGGRRLIHKVFKRGSIFTSVVRDCGPVVTANAPAQRFLRGGTSD